MRRPVAQGLEQRPYKTQVVGSIPTGPIHFLFLSSYDIMIIEEGNGDERRMMKNMTIDEAVTEWMSKDRRMGCVSATMWFCTRVKNFKPIRESFWNEHGDYSEHVVATNGRVKIDLAPYAFGFEE